MNAAARLAVVLSLLILAPLAVSCCAGAQAKETAQTFLPAPPAPPEGVDVPDAAVPAVPPEASASGESPTPADGAVQYCSSERKTTRQTFLADGTSPGSGPSVVTREFRRYEVKILSQVPTPNTPAPERTPGASGGAQGFKTPAQAIGPEMRMPDPPPTPTTPQPAPNMLQPPARPAVSDPGCISAAPAAPTGGGTVQGDGCRTVWKKCSGCGRNVSLTSQAGQRCPHCGGYWSFERQIYMN
jgi:hypothetical protein